MWLAIITVILLLLIAYLFIVWHRLRARIQGIFYGRQSSMETAWQSWITDEHSRDIQRATRATLLDEIDIQVRESIHRNLLELEAVLYADAKPMLAVRRELMDSIDRRQLNWEILNLPEDMRRNLRKNNREILQTDEVARTYIVANEVRMAVLREYSGLRFGDRADGDWFDVYEKASRLRQRSTRHYIERTLDGTQNATDDARFHTMTLMDTEIRTRLLQVPAGTRFPGFNKTVEQNREPA